MSEEINIPIGFVKKEKNIVGIGEYGSYIKKSKNGKLLIVDINEEDIGFKQPPQPIERKSSIYDAVFEGIKNILSRYKDNSREDERD